MSARPVIHHADCLDWLRAFEGEPFDAVITDPPYGLAFMGKDWDRFRTPREYQAWSEAWLSALLRVVQPGAHAAVFGAPKLFHRLGVAAEDAGWELRDTLSWLYGTGFPKSHNLAGDETLPRVPIGSGKVCECDNYVPPDRMLYAEGGGICQSCKGAEPRRPDKHGWGTALKPAWEPILLLRAPLRGSVQANFDAHGVGALHINAARVPLAGETDRPDNRCQCGNFEPKNPTFTIEGNERSSNCRHCNGNPPAPMDESAGRWPANLVLDEAAAAVLDADAQSSPTAQAIYSRPRSDGSASPVQFGTVGEDTPYQDVVQAAYAAADGDDTRPSRFFYVSKASTAEREAGLAAFDAQRRTDGRATESEHPRLRTSKRRNDHPTVKPIDLGRWLTRLLVPLGGRVLDPFAGSGSLGIAAYQEGAEAVGIEREQEYVEIARARIAHWCAQGRMF